jgi:hypothetical protein
MRCRRLVRRLAHEHCDFRHIRLSAAATATACVIGLAGFASAILAAPSAKHDASRAVLRSVVVARVRATTPGWYAFGTGTKVRRVRFAPRGARSVVRIVLSRRTRRGGAAYDAAGRGVRVAPFQRYTVTTWVRGTGRLRISVGLHSARGSALGFARVSGAGVAFRPRRDRFAPFTVSFVTPARARSVVVQVGGRGRQRATYLIDRMTFSQRFLADVGKRRRHDETTTTEPQPPTTTTAPTTTTTPTATPAPPPSSFGAALPAQLPQSSGPSYYVDGASGSDAYSAAQAQSPATPWRTIQHALDVVGLTAATGAPGPTIYIRAAGSVITANGPGSSTPYTSQYLYVQGIWPSTSPLTITNYPGERVLVNSELISGNYAANVRIHGTFVNGQPGLVVDQSYPVLHPGNDGVALIGVRNYEVSGLEIRNSLSQGVYVGSDGTHHVSSANVQILGNYIHNTGCYTCAPNDPTRSDAPLGHDSGIYFGGTDQGQTPGVNGGVIANNIVAHSFDFNIALHNAPWSTYVVNNTLDGWGSGGTPPQTQPQISFSTPYYPASIEISSSVPAEYPRNVVIKNNVGSNSYYGIYYYMVSGTGATGNTEDHNLFFHENVALRMTPSTSGLSYGADVLGADPQWVDPAEANYGLAAGSPAVSAGDAAYTPPTDFFGRARTTADLGAVAH